MAPRLSKAASSALLVIDVQERLAGAMPTQARENVERRAAILLRAAALLGVPALLSEQYPKGLGRTVPTLLGELPLGTPVIEKTCFSCCGEPSYLERLNRLGREQMVLAGMETHVCVLQTALELLEDGKQVFVVEDAVCARDACNTANALARLRQEGAVVTNTESVLFEWLGDARHEQFKAVSALIK